MIPALAAAYLLFGAAAVQDPGAAGTAATQAAPASGKPGVRSPKLRDQLLQGAINVLLQPKPRAATPVPPPAEPAAATTPAATPVATPPVAAVVPVPTAPQPAAVALPQPVKPVPASKPAVGSAMPITSPRPVPRAAPPPPVEPPPSPPPMAESVAPALPVAPSVALPPSAVIEEAETAPVPEPIEPAPGISPWLLLLGLAGAAVVGASGIRLRRIRRIARTRAALSLHPSLDLAAGASSVSGLALVSPSLSIRARLDGPAPQHG